MAEEKTNGFEEEDVEVIYDDKEDLKPAEPIQSVEGKVSEVLARAEEKYLRLYAEFENYKRRVQKDREELLKYGNENILNALLPSLDNLEIALKHASGEGTNSIRDGVEATFRELLRTLDKFGVKPIESLGKPFDPNFHHAISQMERPDVEDNTVIEEFRKGYLYNEKVLRAALVVVSTKPAAS